MAAGIIGMAAALYMDFSGSASTVRGFAKAVEGLDYSTVSAVCIGKQTQAAAAALGMKTYVAKQASMDSIVEVLEKLAARDKTE